MTFKKKAALRKKWKKMSDAAKLLLISPFWGWTDCHTLQVAGRTVCYGWHPVLHPKKKNRYETPLPDCLRDLNAMYQAEEIFSPYKRTMDELERECLYLTNLEMIVIQDNDDNLSFRKYRATAAQRAEAFFLTVMEPKEKNPE